jgi:DNA-binding MarR family transcriptional regulator
MASICREMRLHRKGLSISQFRALVWVDRHPSDTLSSLAEHLGASLSTASRIVAGMVAKGFLTRTGRDDDRRQVSLGMTSKGQAVLDATRAATHSEIAARLAHLTPMEQASILEAMSILRSVFVLLDASAEPISSMKDQ